MPRIDSCQPAVENALKKDNWELRPKQKRLFDEDNSVFIDIEADYRGARRDVPAQTICVEVKCFPGHNPTQEMYISLGQYLMYRTILKREMDYDEPLFLAIPSTIYETIFSPLMRLTCQENGIKLLIIDTEAERILQWIE